MRTPSEILARIEEVEREDWMGTIRGDLYGALPFEDVEPFLKPEAVAAGKEKWESTAWLTDEKVKAWMEDYLTFAIGKATDHRGLSAGRSIDHYRACVWLLGDEEYAAIDWDNYANYGAPILKQIAERYGFPWPEDRDDLNQMAEGLECTVGGCDEGCSS